MATARTPPAKSKLFDGLSFVKYMKNIGRSYRKQAMELVSISRIFAQAQEQTSHSDGDLRSVLEIVDDALCFAAEAQKKTPKDVDIADEKFKMAIDALKAHEAKYHPNTIVAQRMEKAEERDKSSMKALNRLKEIFRPIKEEPTEIVEFHIHKSLPDRRPTIVKQVLGKTSDVKEVLWNFSHFKGEKRLTLKQNPHFYDVLPTSVENYGVDFEIYPIGDLKYEKPAKINVLTDKLGLTGRVFLETAKKTRAFGNVWVPKKAIIFKDVCGKLEGESIVGAAIRDAPNLWWFEEPPPSPTSQSPDRSNPSSTTTPTASPTLLNGNWTDLIRRMLDSLDVNIRISARPPTNSIPSHSAPSSPIQPSFPGGSVGSPSQSGPLTIEIPKPPTLAKASTEPGSPTSYKTAQSTPPSPQSPAPELSSESSTPTAPEPSLIVLTHSAALTPVSNTAAVAHATTSQSPIEPSPGSPAPTSEPHPISTTTRPTALPAHITATPSHATPLQSPTTALPLTGPAEPDPRSSEEISREGAVSGEVSIAEDPLSGPNVNIVSSWKVIDTMPQHVYIKLPDPGFIPTPPTAVTTVVTTAATTEVPIAVTIVLPTAVTPAAPPPKQKKSWFKKCIDVVKNVLH